MPAFLRSSQRSFCGAHSNQRHPPLPLSHSTPESKRPKEGRRTKETVFLPHTERNGEAPPLPASQEGRRCSWTRRRLPIWRNPGSQRLGSCLAPWGCSRGWARAGQRVKPPQYPTLEILSPPPVLSVVFPRALSFLLGAEGSRDHPPRTPCVWERGEDPPRRARTGRTYAGQWRSFPPRCAQP